MKETREIMNPRNCVTIRYSDAIQRAKVSADSPVAVFFLDQVDGARPRAARRAAKAGFAKALKLESNSLKFFG